MRFNLKTLKICLVILCLLPFRAVGTPQLHGANFFMKEIVITSKVRGINIVLVDDDDFDRCKQYAWYINHLGYINHKSHTHGSIGIQRLIMNAPKGMVVDHIDGNPLNNQKSNLRICTQEQNTHNSKKPNTNKSGFKGVYFDKVLGKYRALIRINKKQKHLGCFKKAEDAAKVYDQFATQTRGIYSRLNF